jgi:hypothetical protein
VRLSGYLLVMRQAFPWRPDTRSADAGDRVIDRLLVDRCCAFGADQ